MNSQNKLIAAAVAVALGSAANYAQATCNASNPLCPSAPAGLITIYAGGSASEANAIYVATNNLLNVAASYTSASGGAADSSYRVLYGTLKAAQSYNGVTVNAGTPVLLYYRDSGGAFPNGIEPQAVASPTTLKYASLAALQAATPTVNSLPAATWQYTNDQGVNTAPDWGLADLSVPVFNYPYNLPYANGTTFISGNHPQEAPATVGQSDPLYDDVFGVGVTANVYAVKSNFTKEEINGIWNGTLTDWSQILGDNHLPLAAGGIVQLDRNPGSSAKTVGSVYFLNYPTGIATGSFTVPDSIAFPSSLARYVPCSSGSAPPDCYQDVIEQSAGNVVTDLVAAQNNGDRAIGILNAENAPISNAVSGNNTWDYVAINNQVIDSVGNINGASTNYSNVILGGYEIFYQVVFNTRVGFLSAATPNSALANAWRAEFRLPALAGIVSHAVFPAALNGIVLDADKNAYGPGVATGSRSGVTEAPLAVVYDGTNPINSTINANADPL
jgi:hypothetical protein